MITLTQGLLFSLLVVSPLVGSIMLLLTGYFEWNGNSAKYHSIWTLIVIMGLVFDISGLVIAPNGDYATGLINSWKFISGLSPLLYFGFGSGVFWGLNKLNTNTEASAPTEVRNFLLRVFGATLGALVILVFYHVIAPIASQIN